MAVLGGDGFNLHANTVEEVSGASVWDLVAYMNILVLKEACLGSEFHAELRKGVTTLADSQLQLHRNQPFGAFAQDFRGEGRWEMERCLMDGIRILVGRRKFGK